MLEFSCLIKAVKKSSFSNGKGKKKLKVSPDLLWILTSSINDAFCHNYLTSSRVCTHVTEKEIADKRERSF